MTIRKAGSCCISYIFIVSLGATLFTVSPASAETIRLGEKTNVVDDQREYNIGPGSLDNALLQFSRQSDLQILIPGELAQGLSSNSLQGRFNTATALSTLLSETMLNFRMIGAKTIQVYGPTLKVGSGERQLGPVRVEGLEGQAGSGHSGGGNGSRDVTATEGSGSLNGSMLSVGSKSPNSVKDTPQSVSVISEERMKQQNILNLGDAMEQATGVTVQQGSSSQEKIFYSRGYQINNIQIDGGSPFVIGDTIHRFQPFIDMSMYDHVEILRGADGLFNGNSNSPAGSVNLVRKKPLDHYQLTYEAQAGTWDNYRTSLDVTGLLGFDGALRGRGVVTWTDRQYFYDIAKDDDKILFGSLEADLADKTLLEVGGSYTKRRGTPWYGGLPVYSTGADVGFSRHTALTYPWVYNTSETREFFTSLRQTFNDSWDATLKYTRLDQTNDSLDAFATGSLDVGGTTLGLTSNASKTESIQDGLDVNLNGSFSVFGLTQKVLFGGNYQHIQSGYTAPSKGGSSVYRDADGNDISPFINVLPFDPALPKPVIPSDQYEDAGHDNIKQWGLYSRVEVSPWKPLHLITGWRLNGYTIETQGNTPSYDSGSFVNTPTVSNSTTRDLERPYYAFVLDLASEWSLYGSYANVFQPQLSFISLSGVPIQPLTGTSLEAGLKYAKSDGSINASISVYRLESSGAAVQVSHINPQTGLPDSSSVDLGGGRTGYYVNSTTPDLSRGIDFEVTGRVTPWWQASLGYTFNMNQQGGAADPNSKGVPISTITPKHTFKFWNSFNLYGSDVLDRTKIGVGVLAKSASYSTGVICSTLVDCTNFNFVSPSYAVFSARADYQINDQWDIGLNLNNLFDRHYYETVGTYQGGFWYGEPRNMLLSLRGKFE